MVYLTKFTIVKVQRFESEYLNLLIETSEKLIDINKKFK